MKNINNSGYILLIYISFPILSIATGSMLWVSLLIAPILIQIFYFPVLNLIERYRNNDIEEKEFKLKQEFEKKIILENNINHSEWIKLSQNEKNIIIHNHENKLKREIEIVFRLLNDRKEIILNKKTSKLNSKNYYSKSKDEKLLLMGNLIKDSKSEAESEWNDLSDVEKKMLIKKFITKEQNLNIKKEKEIIRNEEILKEKKEKERLELLEMEKIEERKRIEEQEKIKIEKENEISRIKKENEERRLENIRLEKERKENQIKEQIKNKILESEKRKRIEADAVKELLELGLIDSHYNNDKNIRESIPTHVKLSVWHRDKEQCVNCKSNKNLEFDHIIPISKGGANTINNIQLLCIECNRKKSNKII